MRTTPSTTPAPRGEDAASDVELSALEAACRVLVAISAQSIAAVEDVVDLSQFRAMVIVGSRGALSLGELAEASNLHLSTASRMCDRLVGKGLLHRTDDPDNRRQLTLTLTAQGQRLVRDVFARRRAALAPIVERLPNTQRTQLIELLRAFAAADGEPTDEHLWFMGWPTLSAPSG